MHPREVDAHFAHGKTTNYWGGSSQRHARTCSTRCTTAACCASRGATSGMRIYAAARAAPSPRDAADADARGSIALVDVIVRKYAPLPQRSLAR